MAAFHANLAEAHRALQHHAQAADCSREALRLQQVYPEAANNLGLAMITMDKASAVALSLAR